jgi:SAM-dependent methyltransferase
VSVTLYAEALRSPDAQIMVRGDDGGLRPLDTLLWDGPLDEADHEVAGRVDGATLDVGCGPGRFVSAVAQRGFPVLGIDIAEAAVDLTRRRGGHALQRNVFSPVPATGRWEWALLIDGNVGIGGDPCRLLRRIGELLCPGGRVIVEVTPPGGGSRRHLARLESPLSTGSWFPWATVCADSVGAEAGLAGLHLQDRWRVGHRWFAQLATPWA